MAVISNPNLTVGVGLGTMVSVSGGNFSDTGTIITGAKHLAFQNYGASGGANVTVRCAAAIAKGVPATWVLVPGQSFNPPITPGATFPQFEYVATGGLLMIYAEY